jgi:sigma-E factor negative regulatory protein RseB
VALAVGCALVLLPRPAGAATPVAPPDTAVARSLLERAVAASHDVPHVGEVSIVTFGVEGPRIASLGIRVGTMGQIELRRPTRWVLGGPGRAVVRSGAGVAVLTPSGGRTGLDVDTLLASRAALVRDPVELDTGPAVPVVLRRLVGAPVEETLYVDRATGLLVRRETRGADGRMLRVVAYTQLVPTSAPGPGVVARPAVDTVAARTADGADGVDVDGLQGVPDALDGGFDRITASGVGTGLMTARYSDGLSVLSVYAQPGALDVDAMRSATVLHVAGRDVWTWPGSEPLRLVWTGGDRTWTAVTDAPLEVVIDALASLPGDHVGHDVSSRLLRGAQRARTWITGLFGA